MKLNNHLSRKKIEYIEVTGVVNNDGTLKQRFHEAFDFNEENDYYVSLLSLEFNSFFPNIIKDVNNVFYYSGTDNVVKEITLDEGSYDVKDINSIVVRVTNEGIKIDIEPGSGRSLIFLKPGYKVFLKEKSFNTILGYPDGEHELKEAMNKSPNMCSLIKTNKIFISLNIIEGSNFNGNKSRILYSYPNKEDFGLPVCVEPRYKQKKRLVQKHFIDMTFTFTNDIGEALNFMQSKISLTLEIAEV